MTNRPTQKPTKAEFAAYLKVQRDGKTNMNDTKMVQRLATLDYGMELPIEVIRYIMEEFGEKNYSNLEKEYGLTTETVEEC